MTQEKECLDYLKKYYENFYLQNAARNPESVEDIKYFLDWLNNNATEDDIDCNKKVFYSRELPVTCDVYYLDAEGDYFSSKKLLIYLVSDEYIAKNYPGFYFNEFANSRVIPADLKKICPLFSNHTTSFPEYAHKICHSDKFTYDYRLAPAQFENCKISDPVPQSYDRFTVYYPHPKKDKQGKNIRSFDVIKIFNTYYLVKNEFRVEGPDGKNDKPAAERGCYIATAVYGSYDCPQVWTLRRYRDNTLAATWYGRTFIKCYYKISPTLVKWFGKTCWFQKIWKRKLDKMVKKLNDSGIENTKYEDKIL